MELTRRDFLKASSAVAAAMGLHATGLLGPGDASAAETDDGGVPVIWLQGQGCSGCSVSLLNSLYYATVDDLIVNSLDINFHPNLSAAAGNLAVASVEETYRRGGYVLAVEGAVPSGAGGAYCELWPGLNMQQAVERYAARAAFIVAVGTCACFGGMSAGGPNPTGAQGLSDYYDSKRTIKIPGCPIHPDWLVGTLAYVMANGTTPSLDTYGRPTAYFGRRLHGDWCPLEERDEAHTLGVGGCMEELGCRGRQAHCDCHQREWNTGSAGGRGVNWCCEAGAPCFGCTEPNFPDGMSPFYRFGGDGGGGGGGDDDDEHDDD